MKTKTISMTLSLLFWGAIVFSGGCQSCANKSQPTNPFAMDRTTVPAPATFSYLPTYLGQQGGYAAQPATACPPTTPCPAITYPPSNTVPGATSQPIPPVPAITYPAGSTSSGLNQGSSSPATTYGSISNPASSSYNASFVSTPVSQPPLTSAAPTTNTTTGGWAQPPAGSPITPISTSQTVSQNLDARAGSVSMVSNTGTVYTTADNGVTVSSSQWVTQVGDAAASPATPANPVATNYAGQYSK